jgi:hypothetical protein
VSVPASFGGRLKWLLRHRPGGRLTYAVLAEQVGTTEQTVKDWVLRSTADFPSEDVRIRICDVVGDAEPCWLRYGRGSPFKLPARAEPDREGGRREEPDDWIRRWLSEWAVAMEDGDVVAEAFRFGMALGLTNTQWGRLERWARERRGLGADATRTRPKRNPKDRSEGGPDRNGSTQDSGSRRD